MSVSVRTWLEGQLKPVLPASWRIIPNQRIPETIDRITVMLSFTRIERLPEAPIGSLKNYVTITVADPHQDLVKAENALDDAVNELCTALDGLSDQLLWTGASKVLVKDLYWGWDITVEIITEKEEES